MHHLPYNINHRDFSRTLRNNSTLSEVLLWNKIKNKAIMGYQFNRQKPLGNYIVDFYCRELGLVIEIDGTSHNHNEAYLEDEKRQIAIERLKVSFLRFHDLDVKRNIENVIRTIEAFIIDFENGRN